MTEIVQPDLQERFTAYEAIIHQTATIQTLAVQTTLEALQRPPTTEANSKAGILVAIIALEDIGRLAPTGSVVLTDTFVKSVLGEFVTNTAFTDKPVRRDVFKAQFRQNLDWLCINQLAEEKKIRKPRRHPRGAARFAVSSTVQGRAWLERRAKAKAMLSD